MRFTLKSDHWYACEIIGDEFDEDRCSYSPIRVRCLQTSGTGKRIFELNFYHANYPEGVRNKTYSLQTIERGETYTLVRSIEHKPRRILLIYDIDWAWLERHFMNRREEDTDVQCWLDRNA